MANKNLIDLFADTKQSDDPQFQVYYDDTNGVTAVKLDGKSGIGSVQIGDVTTYTVLAANSGRTHFWPDLTTNLTISLPTAADGLEYTFVYAGVTDDAADVSIDAGSTTNYLLGGLFHADSAGTTVGSVVPDGNSNNVAVINNPGAGTRIHLACDGTNWYISGYVIGATAPQYTD